MRPRVLDLFCGAGMAAEGYASAGHETFGVDIADQTEYPFPWVTADALTWLDVVGAPGFDFIHASPPCQLFTRARHLREAQGHASKETVDLLTPTIERLKASGMPYVIENVEAAGSLMPGAVRVCGSAFGLEVQRHRLFLSNLPIQGTPCFHDRFPVDPKSGKPRPWGVYHVPGDSIPSGGRTALDAEHGSALFGLSRVLPWDSLKEGFPPVYTAYIGLQVGGLLS